MPDPTDSKIIIDSDWKAQAQKEKERLVAKEREAAAKQSAPRAGATATAIPGGAPIADAPPRAQSGPGDPAAPGEAEQYELPPADFRTIVEAFVTQAVLYMGGFADPQTGRPVISLEHAKFNIDLLAVLHDKTKGNLSDDEASDLAKVLNGLRAQFVELTRAIAQMQARAAMEAQAAAMGKGPAVVPQLRLRPE